MKSTANAAAPSGGHMKSVTLCRDRKGSESVTCVTLESKIGERVYVPGGGIGEIHSFFGSTFDGELQHFVRVKLAGGRVAIFQIRVL